MEKLIFVTRDVSKKAVDDVGVRAQVGNMKRAVVVDDGARPTPRWSSIHIYETRPLYGCQSAHPP